MIKVRHEIRLPMLFLATLLLNAGAAFMWPLTTIYMNKMLHKSLTTAGMTLLIMSLMMMVGNYVGGRLFDHWSPYKTGLLGAGLSLAAMIALIFSHGWPMFGILLVIVGFGDGISLTVSNSFGATIKHHTTRQVFNALYIALNVGVVIGTLLVGYLLALGITVVFIVTTACYVALFLIMVTEFRIDLPIVKRSDRQKYHLAKPNLHQIWILCGMVFTIYASYSLWESVLSVHMTNLHIAFHDYSLLWTLNGLMIVIGQPIMNRLFAHRSLPGQIAGGTLLFASSFFLLTFASQYWTFVVIMIVLTIGEMIGFPGLPAWVDSLSLDAPKGEFQGLYNISISLGRAVGPLFGGLMIDYFSYQSLFLTVTIAMVLMVAWTIGHYLKSGRTSA